MLLLTHIMCRAGPVTHIASCSLHSILCSHTKPWVVVESVVQPLPSQRAARFGHCCDCCDSHALAGTTRASGLLPGRTTTSISNDRIRGVTVAQDPCHPCVNMRTSTFGTVWRTLTSRTSCLQTLADGAGSAHNWSRYDKVFPNCACCSP